MQGTDLVSVSQRWKSRIAASPDYVVVPHDNKFRMGLYSSAIGESAYSNLGQYLHLLCRRYEGVAIEDAIDGNICHTEEGPCFCIKTTEEADISGPNHLSATLAKELRLVHGIGPKAAEKMQRKGCTTIQHLEHMRRYRKNAAHALDALNAGPAQAGYLIRTRLGPSHPLGLVASEAYDPSGLRFIDLETLGIFGRPVILFGIGCPSDDGFVIHQILLRSIDEEPAALSLIHKFLDGASALVSYNGRAFDWPYLKERTAYYGLDGLPDLPHIDLLHYARRFWKRTIPDCRLSSIEQKILHINREIDIPGFLVPEWYSRYMETGNCGPLIPIVRHNRQDIASLAHLLTLLRSKARECC